MEVIISAIIGELAGRSISFLIDKYLNGTAPTEEERLDDLRRLLLRVRVIVEEAEGRHITNQAMVQQLNILRKEMYRGYYTQDNFRSQANGEEKAKDHEVSHPFALSKFNHAKRVCFCSGSSQIAKDLQQVIGSLETIIRDMNEFIMLSSRYPHFPRQPYSMYLFLDNYMFDRQTEMGRVISFLFQAETPTAEHLGVLPIIGPGTVGKSTLVEHVCIDGRVRDHFSQIVFFSRDDIEDENTVTLRDGGVIKHQNRALDGERVLVIVELDGDLDEGLWGRLYSASKSCIACDSKIIVTSRSNKVASFGTTRPLELQLLSQEAYWYFFKVRTFGSMDPAEHPKLVSIAMDVAREANGNFKTANIFSELMRSNVNAHFWSLALAALRGFKKKNMHLFSANPADPWEMTRPKYIPRANRTYEHVVVLDNYITGCYALNEAHNLSTSGHSSAPKMTVQDIVFGTAMPQGKFHVLAWRSHIPPYCSCVLNCEVRKTQRMIARKKRTQKIGC